MSSVVEDCLERVSTTGASASEVGIDNSTENNEDCDDDFQYIFPQRLMSILSDEKNHDAICWLPHGKGFVIRNRKLFAEKIMPRFFPRKSKYSSFTRKLNRWNFVRVSSGPELGAYYHEFFLRDKPHLAVQMFCKNARTLIALASDTKGPVPPLTVVAKEPPATLPQMPSVVPIQQCQHQQPIKSSDAAATELSLRRHQIDSAMQFMLSQQNNLYKGQKQQPAVTANPTLPLQLDMQGFSRLQQQQLPRNQVLTYGAGSQPNISSIMAMAAETMSSTNTPSTAATNSQNSAASSMNLWQQIQAQKQQEAQMMQLRQLMALNLQQQQQQKNRNKSCAKKFRASAA